MAYSRRSLISLLVFFLASASLWSQANGAQEIPLQFRVVSLSGPIMVEYDDGEKKMPVNANMGSFSRLYDTDSRRVSFYRRAKSEDPKVSWVKQKVAEFTLPSGDGPFLVFLKANGGPLQYSTAVYDGSVKAHKPNSYRLLNFGHRDLAVQLGKENLMLKPGQQEYVDYPNERKIWLKVAADSAENGWLLVNSSPHIVGQDTRTTILLTDIPASERDPDPLGVAVRKMRERVVTDEMGFTRVR